MESFVIQPAGPFSLEEAALFGFGQRHDDRFDGTMRLAFCVDGYTAHAGVALTQAPDGSVRATVSAGSGGPVDVIAQQVARVLSLDHDATGYAALARQDPVIDRLMHAAPGLRPPLFYSPYEAALWAVLSQRRSAATSTRWRQRLSQAAGASFEVAGTEMWSVPTPEAILELGAAGVSAAAGVEVARAERVVGVAEAARAGLLDAGPIAAVARRSEDDARRSLIAIPGIGPFYADLIVIRASGVTDVLPVNEPRFLALMGTLYGHSGPFEATEAARQAEAWRPWRTWVAVLFRAAGPRVLAAGSDAAAGPQMA
jgi:DNA-3-methyladenine glycosylase II